MNKSSLCRTYYDFYEHVQAEILSRHADRLSGGGVVHSFDGTWDEAKSFLDLGYLIGINGW